MTVCHRELGGTRIRIGMIRNVLPERSSRGKLRDRSGPFDGSSVTQRAGKFNVNADRTNGRSVNRRTCVRLSRGMSERLLEKKSTCRDANRYSCSIPRGAINRDRGIPAGLSPAYDRQIDRRTTDRLLTEKWPEEFYQTVSGQ